MSPKMFYVVLGLVILLFMLGVGVGVNDAGDRGAKLDPGWVKALGKQLVRQQPLPIEDVKAPVPPICLEDRMVVVSRDRPCALTLAESEAPVRTLKLLLAQGPSVTVTLRQEGKITVSEGLTDTEKQFDIFQDGGTLTFEQSPTTDAASKVELR